MICKCGATVKGAGRTAAITGFSAGRTCRLGIGRVQWNAPQAGTGPGGL